MRWLHRYQDRFETIFLVYKRYQFNIVVHKAIKQNLGLCKTQSREYIDKIDRGLFVNITTSSAMSRANILARLLKDSLLKLQIAL